MIFHYKDFVEHNYNFAFKTSGTMILSGLENSNVVFSEVSVNGKKYLNEKTNIAPIKISYNFDANEKIRVSIITKKNIEKLNIFDYINYYAFTIFVIFYFLVFIFIFYNINPNNCIKSFLIRNKSSIILFIFLTFIYIVLCKNFYLNTDYFRTYILGSDVPWVIEDIFSPTIRRFHPYFFTFFYPILEFILYIVKDKLLSLGILYSLISAMTCFFIYKIMLFFLNKHRKIALLLTLIYAFSFCQLIFTAFFETYLLTGFYLSIITYLIVKEMLADKSSTLNLFLIILFSALSFGVSMSNIIPVSVLIASSLYTKYKDKKKIIKIFFYIMIIIIFLLYFRYLTATNMLITSFFNMKEINEYLNKIPLRESISNFIQTSIYQVIIAPKLIIRNGFSICTDTFITVNFGKYTNIQSIFSITFLFCFILLWIFSLLQGIKCAIIKNKALLFAISLTLLINFILVTIWQPMDGFLFALSHLQFWFIIMSLSIGNILNIINDNIDKNKEVYISNTIIILLLLFLAFEIIFNLSSLDVIYGASYKIYNKGI